MGLVVVGEPIVWRPEPERARGVAVEGAVVEPFRRFLLSFSPWLGGILGDLRSSSLSGRSLESPSSSTTLFGVLRAGAMGRIALAAKAPERGAGTSSSESSESANLLRKAGRMSSSSLESAKRDERWRTGFCAGFAEDERPKPRMRLDVSGFGPRSVGAAPTDPRSEFRMWVSEPLVKGWRVAPPVGDKDRRLNRLDRTGD